MVFYPAPSAVSLAFHLTLDVSVSYWMQYKSMFSQVQFVFPTHAVKHRFSVSLSPSSPTFKIHNRFLIRCSEMQFLLLHCCRRKKNSNHGFGHCEWWRWWCKCKSQKQKRGLTISSIRLPCSLLSIKFSSVDAVSKLAYCSFFRSANWYNEFNRINANPCTVDCSSSNASLFICNEIFTHVERLDFHSVFEEEKNNFQ